MNQRMSGRFAPGRSIQVASSGSMLDIFPSGEMSPNAMTVTGLVVGMAAGAGLMHLAHKYGWLGMGPSTT